MIFIGSHICLFAGLSKRTTSEKLQEAFSQFGEVVHGLFLFCEVVTFIGYFLHKNQLIILCCLQLEW